MLAGVYRLEGDALELSWITTTTARCETTIRGVVQ